MSVTQFNATYVAEEDRVLFKFNTSEQQEFRLWFTRALVRDLLSISTQASVVVLSRAHPPEQARAITEFNQQAKAQDPQFTTYVPAPNLPLGPQALLVNKAQVKVNEGQMALELFLPQGQLMTVRVNEDMLGQLHLILQTVARHANWGLEPPAAPSTPDDASAVASESATTKPSKVLH